MPKFTKNPPKTPQCLFDAQWLSGTEPNFLTRHCYLTDGTTDPTVSGVVEPPSETSLTTPKTSDPHRHTENGSESTIITGWRLPLVIFALCGGLFLCTLETTIVATALVTISSEFEEFDSANWIVLAYLVTYCGFLVIYARLSDIFGRKSVIFGALSVFTLFSILCGVAQSMTQLIIFRAFQGLGGSGIFSMVFVTIFEVVPPARLGIVSGLVGAVFASSSVVGPTVGGAITSNTTWRWIFYLNIPCGVILLVIIAMVYPRQKPLGSMKEMLSRIDWPGAVLLLAGSIILIFALQEGGARYPWRSAAIIACLIIAGLCWVAFGFWESLLTKNGAKIRMIPIFPTRLIRSRVVGTALGCALMSGSPFTVSIIALPQRFQIVNGKSPVAAGIALLPLLLLSAVGSGAGGAILSKKNIAFYVLMAANVFQILGTGLLSSLPTSQKVPVQIYPYMAILGIGFGLSVVSMMVLARTGVALKDQAVSQGSITQMRVLGGVVGLAICSAVASESVKSKLNSTISSDQLQNLLQSSLAIAQFSPEEQKATRRVYGSVFNTQMKIVMGFALASFVLALFTFERHPRSLEEVHGDYGKTEASASASNKEEQ